MLKIEEEDIDNIWFQQDGATCHTAEATLDVLQIAISAAYWSPKSCDLTPLVYYLWDAVKDKYYAVKLETIGALKDNEIQLHTIDVLINWTDRVGYCMASRGSNLN